MDDDIIKMYEAGLSVGDIATELDKPKAEITKCLHEAGLIQKAGRKSSNEKLSDEQRNELVTHYVEGTLSGVQIISQYDITWNGLYKILDEEKVPYRDFKQRERIARNSRLERAIEMYNGGARLWEILQETGIRQPSLHAALHERNLPLRRDGNHTN